MLKKILIVLGILLVLSVLGSIILVSLSGATSRRVDYSSGAPSFGEVGSSWNSKSVGGSSQERESVGGAGSKTSERLVVKKGTLNIVVKDIEGSAKSIIQYAKDRSGWVVSSSLTERKKVPRGSVTIRVPVENFDEAIVYFRGLAQKVTYEGTRGQDVTEEYTDLQSRLRNLEATEIQLLKIMERSGTIPDVLAAQRELTKVRGQIEQTKGRIQYLKRSAKMATITVNLALSEELLPIPPAEKWRPKYVLLQAWRSLLGFLRGISYLLVWIIVYALIWLPLGAIIWWARMLWKKKREKRAKQE